MRWLLARLGMDAPHRLPIYIGTDAIDEDAFQALRGKGVSALLCQQPRPTTADFRLGNLQELIALLRGLIRISTEGA
jgi:trehalose-6-phosphatase